jgi:hypothetical protein
MQISGGEDVGFQVAYLQAIFPSQSESSRYHLVVMDRDGSNRQVLFPPAGAPGLEPQEIVWSPDPLAGAPGEDGNEGYLVAVIYQNNLWLVDPNSGEAWQLTGDGLVSRLDWH